MPAFSRGFVERLPGQLDALCEALEEERLEDVERLAHRIKGVGGSYGYPTLSEAARSLELAAKARDAGGAAAALAGVKEVCAAIQTGWTARTADPGTGNCVILPTSSRLEKAEGPCGHN